VWVTHTAEEALARAALHAPDAAIVEMSLADSSGTELCRRLREWSSVPLIMLSHDSDEDGIVAAFDAGADDFITKPFRPRELVARVQMHIRRAATRDDEPVVLCHGLRIDLAARAIHRDGREIRLTPLEHRLLCALVRDQGRLLTHDDLLQKVWGSARAEDRQTLRAHMANLRRKLASPSSGGVIRTYPGVGYLFDRSPNPAPATLPPTRRKTRSTPLRIVHAA
jgi:two-component system, OmpR family, KDP operon response regulator KdpE